MTRKSKVSIVQIYLPSKKTKSNRLQRKIRSIINTKLQANFQVILIGDFNIVYNPSVNRSSPPNGFRPTWKPEITLFEFLDNLDFTDTQQFWEQDILSPIWKGFVSYSRIDFIQTSASLSNKHLLNFENEDIKDITNSDYTLLTIELINIHLFQRDPISQRIKDKSITIIDLQQTIDKH